METILVNKSISLTKLKDMAAKQFGDMIKAVIDIDAGLMVVGGELHADQEIILLDQGSKQEYLWGINLWVDKEEDHWIEFMINIRPSQSNRSRMVEDPQIREIIIQLVNKMVQR